MKSAKTMVRTLSMVAARSVVLAATFAFAPLLTNVLSVTPVRAAETVVNIGNFTFNPQRVTVKVGTAVTWINGDDIPHTATSSTKLFKSKTLDTDEKFSFTFTKPGTYEYFCSLHPHMKGRIVVKAQ